MVASDAELAGCLGISPRMVRKLKKRGMPTHSVEAAREWRYQNLDPAFTKDGNPARERSGEKAPDDDDRILQAVEAAAAKAGELVGSRAFGQHAPVLRKLMRLVPRQRRPEVSLEPAVWRALIGGDMIASFAAETQREEAEAAPQAGAHQDDEEDEEAGALLYSIACGELVRASPLPVAEGVSC